MISTKKDALEIVGSLSEPSKMPGYGWSISAHNCARGSMLAKKPGTICSNCYALKGRYVFPNVKNAHDIRKSNLDNPLWVEAMIFLLKNESYFRWFDSGDIQSVAHLEKIVEVCQNTPNCKHWLPTREIRTVILFLDKGGIIPDNLALRISADKIGELPLAQIKGCLISTSSYKNASVEWNANTAHNCPVDANKNIKTCDQANCKACWNKNVYHINYEVH